MGLVLLVVGLITLALAVSGAAAGRAPTVFLRVLLSAAMLAFAIRLILLGQTGLGLLLGFVAAGVGFWQSGSRRRRLGSRAGARARPKTGTRTRVAPPPPELAEAREILGVAAGASAEEIRVAHRRLVAQVHPDKGGSAYLTHRVNAARDILLRALHKGERSSRAA